MRLLGHGNRFNKLETVSLRDSVECRLRARFRRLVSPVKSHWRVLWCSVSCEGTFSCDVPHRELLDKVGGGTRRSNSLGREPGYLERYFAEVSRLGERNGKWQR